MSTGRAGATHIVTDRETGRSKGFGFVEMNTAAEAEQAIKSLNNTEFEGRTLIVNEARPQVDKARSGGYPSRY
jgi:RNA recognition motif-containing protein